MMVQLSDDLFASYERLALESGAISPKAVIEAQLARYADVDPRDRAILVRGEARDALEAILGGGHLTDAADLVAKVQRLADIQIGQIRVRFTPGQLEELKSRAERNGISVAEETRRIVRDMEAMFFDRLS